MEDFKGESTQRIELQRSQQNIFERFIDSRGGFGKCLCAVGAVVLASAGLFGISKVYDALTPRVPKPEPRMFQNLEGSVSIPLTYESQTTLYIKEDGRVISSGGLAHWVEDGYTPANPNIKVRSSTRTMTANIVELARQAQEADRKLAKALAERAYELQERK